MNILKAILKYTGRVFAVIGFLVVLGTVAGIWVAQAKMKKTAKPPEQIVLMLNFNDDLVEEYEKIPASLGGFFTSMTQEQPVALHDVIAALDRGTRDPRVLGVVGLFGKNLPKTAHGQEIRSALEKFRAAGKFSYAYSPSYGEFGPGNSAYYLASGFEEVWLQPVGTLGLNNLRMEQPFASAALDKIGVKPRFVQREEYKTAMQFLTEEHMTAPAREMLQSLLDDMNDQLASGIAAGRKMTAPQVKALMANGPYTAKEALAQHLIDRIGYSDEIDHLLEEKYGKNYVMMRPDSYAGLPLAADKKEPPPKATVGLVIARGEIGDEKKDFSPLSGGVAMDAAEITKALHEASEDNDVKLIILRVDSPGGSPAASETIRRAVTQAQVAGKKIIVSMGAMAGSGGYWIAMNGNRIFADPATLTGSIGVVGGKMVLRGLYEKIGMNWEVLQTEGRGGMWSTLQDNSPEEQARMDALMDDTYNAFRDNVAAARKIPADKMPLVSKGRVFTGAQAVRLGLVDELGGLHDALLYAKADLGLQPDDPIDLRVYPRRVSPAQRFAKLMKQYLRHAAMPEIAAGMAGMTMGWLESLGAQPMAARMPLMRVE